MTGDQVSRCFCRVSRWNRQTCSPGLLPGESPGHRSSYFLSGGGGGKSPGPSLSGQRPPSRLPPPDSEPFAHFRRGPGRGSEAQVPMSLVSFLDGDIIYSRTSGSISVLRSLTAVTSQHFVAASSELDWLVCAPRRRGPEEWGNASGSVVASRRWWLRPEPAHVRQGAKEGNGRRHREEQGPEAKEETLVGAAVGARRLLRR